MLRKKSEMANGIYENCHGGTGNFEMFEVLKRPDSDMGIKFVHEDFLNPGTTFGEHTHTNNEEMYYVIEGSGIMVLDGQQYPMKTGDVSLVKSGHSHGLINSGEGVMRLLVVCVDKNL